MNDPIYKHITDEAGMLQLGAVLASICTDTTIISLSGPLGAGKTTFARGFLQALGHAGYVKSPTYTLVETYVLPTRTVHHFDFYRLHDPHELEAIGIQDYFVPPCICLMEWPEQGEGVLPPPDLSCYIELCANGREVKITAHSEHGHSILQRLHYGD